MLCTVERMRWAKMASTSVSGFRLPTLPVVFYPVPILFYIIVIINISNNIKE